MIQGILSFQFKINQKETGEIEPKFEPIQLIFRDEEIDESKWGEFLHENDLFAVFYQHITGLSGVKYSYSNFFNSLFYPL